MLAPLHLLLPLPLCLRCVCIFASFVICCGFDQLLVRCTVPSSFLPSLYLFPAPATQLPFDLIQKCLT